MPNAKQVFADILQTLEEWAARDLDGSDLNFRIQPPVDDAYLEALERLVGAPLPDDLIAFARQTRGLDDPWLTRMTLPESPEDENPDAPPDFGEWGFPKMLRFGHDGFGNYLYLEPGAQSTRAWFFCHDPAYIALMARSLVELFEQRLEWIRAYIEFTESELDEDRESLPEPDGPPERYGWERVDARTIDEIEPGPNDETLASLIAGRPGDLEILDLRDKPTPVGFDTSSFTFVRGPYGPPSEKLGELFLRVPPDYETPDSGLSDMGPSHDGGAEFDDEMRDVDLDPWWKFW